MRYFDLHCDTITECCLSHKPLRGGGLHVDLDNAGPLDTYVQCYAAWIPDELKGEEAVQRFQLIAQALNREIAQNRDLLSLCREPGDLDRVENEKKHGAVLTVENGSALGGKLENVGRMRDLGVRMCTLTWNGENELGRGVMAEGTIGLTAFGKQAVREFEKNGIVVDISHASPELFWDVAEIAQKPLVASHSNAKKLCSHPRNLTDEQFMAIRDSGGLVGLNAYRGFLNNEPDRAYMEDIVKHAEHFLSLGGENALSMGGDFDGAQLPAEMHGLKSIPQLYELFLRHNYSESLLEKIFYGNAARFFREQNMI